LFLLLTNEDYPDEIVDLHYEMKDNPYVLCTMIDVDQDLLLEGVEQIHMVQDRFYLSIDLVTNSYQLVPIPETINSSFIKLMR
jgi:hypothetical protein